jgi:hypothetical protein
LLLVGYLALAGFDAAAVVGFIVCVIVGGTVAYPLAFRAEKKAAPYRYIKSRRHRFPAYLLRYLLQNKPYLYDTALVWAFGCVFAVLTSASGFPAVLPLGFALMCLNTPLGILLSSDRALERQIKLLPRQTFSVFVPYALFVATVNAVGCAIYLMVWRLLTSSVNLAFITVAGLFALTGGVLTVLLEVRFPLLDWKVQSDLWHHPRKYIVPVVMVLLSLPVAMLIGGM